MVVSSIFTSIFCYWLLASNVASGKKKQTSHTVLRFKEFGDCGRNDTPNRITKATVTMKEGGVNLINLDFVVVKPFAKAKIRLTILKCPDECEIILKFSLNLCDLLEGKGMPWRKFMENISPKMECPVKKGTYQVVNGIVDGNEIMKMSSVGPSVWVQQFDWKVVFEIIGRGEEVLTCGRSLWTISRTRHGIP